MPYTTIFPKGFNYYKASPLSENVTRYQELLTRAASALSGDDAALVTLQQTLPSLIGNFAQAAALLDAQRTQAAVARTALDAKIDEWHNQMEKTYGALAAELTRKGADRFFPRDSSTHDAPPDEPPPPATP